MPWKHCCAAYRRFCWIVPYRKKRSTACMRRCTPRPWRRPSACAHAYRCCGAARVHRRDPFRNGSGRRDGNAGVRQQYGAVSHPRAGRRAACKMHAPTKARGDRAVSAVRRAVRSAPRLARDEKAGGISLATARPTPRAPCTASKFAALSLPCAARVSGTAETVRCGGFSKPCGSF